MDTSVYEQLDLLNKHFREALASLRRLQNAPELRDLRAQTYELQLEELRSCICEQIMSSLSEVELRNAARFWRKRRAIETSRKDSKKALKQTKARKATQTQKG
jgi:hypothetical protein